MTDALRSDATAVCVIGTADDPYTRLVLYALREQRVPISHLLLVRREGRGGGPATRARRALAKLLSLRDRPGPYQTLAMYDPLFWGRLFANRAFLRSTRRRELMGAALETAWDALVAGADRVEVPSVNHARALITLQEWRPRLMLLGGVGLVAAPLLDLAEVTLNAHPAPLPECPGGGALEFTLLRGLEPTATVHVAVARADAGPILDRRLVPIERADSWESLELRLTVACARLLAQVAASLVTQQPLALRPNGGTLNRWSDCTRAVQSEARRELRRRQHRL